MTRDRIIELKRNGSHFIMASDADHQEADVFDEDWFQQYISTHCKLEQHETHIHGTKTSKPIFVSNDDNNVAFCVLDAEEEISNFEMRPKFMNFVDQHVRKYDSSETFYEPYKLSVRSQILPSPIYRIQSTNTPFHFAERVTNEAMLSSHYAVVLGAPGIGKTTFVRHLAQQMIDRAPAYQNRHAPILVSLRRFEYDEFSSESLQHYLRVNESDEIADLVGDNLTIGLFRFFLDGLDEIQQTKRSKIYDGIREFSKNYPKNSYLITARDSVFEEAPQQVDLFRLGDWDDFLIKRWCYENLKEHQAWKHFYSNIAQNIDGKDVFRNPLMLNLAAYLFEQYNMLPHRKVDLFFNVINAVIDEWDKARGIKRSVGLWKSPRHKLSVLSYIAFQQLASGTSVVSEDTVQNWIGERTSTPTPNMCRALAVETGMLTEVREGAWTFVHRSIQEYLAAVFIVDSTLRPLDLLTPLDSDSRNRILSYISNMVSNNDQFAEQVLGEVAIPDIEKGQIITIALSEGMELDNKLKSRVYELVSLYLREQFSTAGNIELKGKHVAVTASNNEAATGISNTLYLIARLGRTKFGEEFRDIAKAVLPRNIFSIVSLILGSSAFFITKAAKGGIIEGKNETQLDFTER